MVQINEMVGEKLIMHHTKNNWKYNIMVIKRELKDRILYQDGHKNIPIHAIHVRK
jgi:hypothetical protein